MHARTDILGIDGRQILAWRNPAGQHPAKLGLARGPGGALRALIRSDDVWVWKADRLNHSGFCEQTGFVGIAAVLRPGRVALDIRAVQNPTSHPWAIAGGSVEDGPDWRRRSLVTNLRAHAALRELIGWNWTALWFY